MSNESVRETPATTSSSGASTPSTPSSGTSSASPKRVQLKRSLAADPFEVQLRALTPVQNKSDQAGAVHEAAAAGIASGGGAMPHADKIQASFGGHDISGVQAHTGASAAQASKAMGAEAYATGNHVVFGGAPDLHTAAHEAAHVVQQQAGVSLAGGVGRAGDRYEQHADKVADAVVAGKSAEGLLSQMTGGGPGVQRSVQRAASPVKPAAVQRRVWHGAARENQATFVLPPGGLNPQDREALTQRGLMASTSTFEETWTSAWKAICEHLGVNPELSREGIEAQAKDKFKAWVDERSAVENAGYQRPEGQLQSPERAAAEAAAQGAPAPPPPGPQQQSAHTEQRVYPQIASMAVALIHESNPEYADRLAIETELAMKVAADPQYGGAVKRIASALAAGLSTEDQDVLEKLAQQSRYKSFSSLPKTKAILAGGGDVGEVIIFLDEYNNYWPNKSAEFERCKLDMRETFGDMRVNGYTVNEDNPWVKEARALGMPLMAGPSGTTNGILALGQSLGLDGKTLYKVAWAMHAFFNGMWRGQSGTHRMHEVMSVAKGYCGAAFTYFPSMRELG